MPGYKDDRLALKIANFDERLNQEDDQVGTDENTPEDMFFAVGEEHASEDSVEVETYDPSTFAWADATSDVAGFEWNYGGRWSDA